MKARKKFDLVRSELASDITLIEASAGTGKTHAISGLVLRLVLEKQLAIEEILVTTFTELATAELRDRIRNLLVQALTAFETGDWKRAEQLLAAVAHSDRAKDLLLKFIVDNDGTPPANWAARLGSQPARPGQLGQHASAGGQHRFG